MKICELRIQHSEDRARLVSILAFAGYKVSIEERGDIFSRNGREYFVIVESKESEAAT